MACSGRVKSWNDNKGFGFIEAEGEEDIFVHRSHLVGCEALKVGDEVKFDKTTDEQKGKTRAENVTGGTGTKGAGKGAHGTGSHWGKVKSWNEDRGFGFIEQAGEEDSFVHRSDLVGCEALQVGDQVNYNRMLDEKTGKHKAQQVTGGTGWKGGGGKGGWGGGGGSWGGSGSWGGGGGYGAAGYGAAGYGAAGYGGGYGGGYGSGGYGSGPY